MKYRKRPVEIEAVQLRWDTWNEVCDLTGPFPEGMSGVFIDHHGNLRAEFPGDGPMGTVPCRIGLRIPTLEGTMLAIEGDYIIKGIAGELYPCKAHIFESTYDPVEESALAS